MKTDNKHEIETPETDEVLRRNAVSDQTPEEDYEALADHAANLEYRLGEMKRQMDLLIEATRIANQDLAKIKTTV